MTEPYAILVTYVNELAMRISGELEATSHTEKIDPCKRS
jgi:hypothetical protein